MIMKPTQWQRRVMETPEDHDLAILAGRGCGKSAVGFFLLARHAAAAGRGCRALYLRKTRTALRDAIEIAWNIFEAADAGVSFNANEGVWTFSNGAKVYFGELADDAAVRKWTGASLSYVVVDEVQQHASPSLIDRLYASLRLTPGRMVLLGHGGDVGDIWLQIQIGRAHV